MGVAEGLLGLLDNVIIVDDGTTDGSLDPVCALPVSIVRIPGNLGKGHALLSGFRRALEDPGVDCVACLDADGQQDPKELPGLYRAFADRNADFLMGAREFGSAHVPLRSRIGNEATVRVVGWLFGVRIPDTQSGYRLLSRRFLEEVALTVPGGRYETEMELLGHAIRGNYTFVSKSIKTVYERGNPSSHFRKIHDSWRIYRALLRDAWRARKDRRNSQ
jgi:glycosyltransferase involved in cell wall biosynthesis